MSARRPPRRPKPPGVSARRRFFDRCFIDRDDGVGNEIDPVLGVPVKDWNLFRGFCRGLGIDVDQLRQLLADDPRRAMMAPEMEALMTELYQRGVCSLDLFDAYWHERGMIASEDPRPNTPEEQQDVDELYSWGRKLMEMSPEEMRAERVERRRARFKIVK